MARVTYYLPPATLSISVTATSREFFIRLLWGTFIQTLFKLTADSIIQSFGPNARRIDSLVPPTNALQVVDLAVIGTEPGETL